MQALMAGDKKVRAGVIRLVLLDAIGTARLVDDYPPEALAAELRAGAAIGAAGS